MANVIKLKSGDGAPTNSDITTGELAVDTTNLNIWQNVGGTVKQIGTGQALKLAGGTMNGSIDMDANSISGVRNFAFDGESNVSSVKDEDDMSSNQSQSLATQQSIKAYVDSTPVVTHIQVHNYYTSSGSGQYIPFGGSQAEYTSLAYNYGDDNRFVAPFDGTLKKLWLRNDYNSTVNPSTTACYLDVNGTTGNVMNAGFVTWNYQTAVAYACTQNNTFSEGDVLAIKVDPVTAPRYVTITSIWEYTT